MNETKKLSKKEIIKNLMPIVIFVIFCVILTFIFLPQIKRLGTEEGREAFRSFIDSLGIFGWLIGLGLCILQILVAFIPGEPVELLMGYVFGPIWGTLICLFSSFLAASGIFFLVKRLGVPFIKKAVGEKDIKRFKFLSNEKHLEICVLILFLVPATPKDVLLYIVPLSRIGYLNYILITTLARIPSIVTSTMLGGSIARGDYFAAVIVFVITALLALFGIIFGNRYVENKTKSEKDFSTKS